MTADQEASGAEAPNKPFRVLSLDGGGAKGFYTLGALREIEGICGAPLSNTFDLIYGTSTGAIIAALLALGKSVAEVEELYREHVVAVMSRWMPWNKTKELEKLAAHVFKGMKFDAFKTNVGIVGTRWQDERPIIFKSNPNQASKGKATFEPGFGCTIGDVVIGSCSAYPFFSKKIVTTGKGDIIDVRDGGFVANNPTLYAIVDATETLKHARKDVRVISIGVGEYPAPDLPTYSVRKWLSRLPSMIFLQKTMSISTQSMDQLRKVQYGDVPTVRIHKAYTEPHLATDMLEVDLKKLNLLLQRGSHDAREEEAKLKKYLL